MVRIPRLREWREARALTQVELAERAGVSPRSVAGYEAGGGARPPTVRKLAGALEVEVRDLFPLEQAPPSPTQPPLNGGEEERREPKLPEAAVDGPYRWTQDKTTEELQQIALEEAQLAKPQTYEELSKGHKEDKKVQLEEAHRRTMAYANIANINEELSRRGARSPVELATKQFNDAMSAPEEAPQEGREKQEGQEGQEAG